MNKLLRLDWTDFKSRLLKLTRPTDWAYLPNNKEREIYALVTKALRRFPMQPEWPPTHPDMKAEDWHQRFPTRAQLLVTDAAFEQLVLEQAIAEDMATRALRRYLAVKRDEELSALEALALEEEKFKRAFQKQRHNALQQEMLIRLAHLEERDRIASRYAEEIEERDTVQHGNTKRMREALNGSADTRTRRNARELEKRDALQHDRTGGMRDAITFNFEKHAAKSAQVYAERDADWRDLRLEKKEAIRKEQAMPPRENDPAVVDPTHSWAYGKRDELVRQLATWHHDEHAKRLADVERLAFKLTPKNIEDLVYGARGAPQREAEQDRKNRVTDAGRSIPGVEATKLDESAGRAAYVKASKRTRSG